jgi:hypothetical protein
VEALESRLALTGYIVDLSLTLTNPDGLPLTALNAGDDFVLHAWAQDVRDAPEGVFAAYMDITWDSNVAAVAGPIRYGQNYGSGQSGTIAPGLINEAGGFSGVAELGGERVEVFSVAMQATASGALTFIADPVDLQPQHAILEYNAGTDASGSLPIANELIHYGTVAINVGGSTLPGELPVAVDDNLNAVADTGTVLDVLSNDSAGSSGGLSISAIGTPGHGTASDNGGSIIYRPAAGFTGIDTFTYTIRNGSGQSSTAMVTVTVAAPNFGLMPHVDFDLEVTRPDGSALTSLGTGEDFVLHVFTQDRTKLAHGVYAAYLDLTWDGRLAVVTGPIQYNGPYQNGKSGDATASGLLNEAGAFTSNWLSGQRYEVFSVPMRATATGDLVFLSDPSDASPEHDVLVSGLSDGHVADNQISFGSALIHVGTFGTSNDTFSVNEDSKNNSLAPLANDASTAGSVNTLVISAVGPTDHGGTVTIGADGTSLRYTPAANFNGVETFTYTVRNQSGEEHTATVTVNVAEVNDPPTAVNDSFSAARGSTSNVFNVLDNDSIAPDSGETLQIIAVSKGNHGGAISIAADGAHVIYTPAANFTGTETLTYTIRDRVSGGLTAKATVSVVVSGPAAAPDTISIPADGTSVPLNVLANDSAGRQGGQLTIVDVTQPASGNVSISPDGTYLLYSNAMSYNGAVYFAYAVTDSIGEVARAAVTLNVGAAAEPGVTLDGGVLRITGSDQQDMVIVSAGRRVIQVMGIVGEMHVSQSFKTSDVQRIEAMLGGGDDFLSIAGNVRAAVLADGGAGNDTIFAGGGSAILLGGEGNDRLFGGSRRDVIIGGAGQDQISGGGDSDILIGGTTAYDGDHDLLLAIQAQWNVRASRASRIASLRDWSGSFVQPLGVSLVQDVTVFDDGAVDTVFGMGNVDWVFGDVGAGQGLVSVGRLKKGAW